MTKKKTAADEAAVSVGEGFATETVKKRATRKKKTEPVVEKEVPSTKYEVPRENEEVSSMPEPLGITVVIPFKANAAKGNELLFAVRAWEKHLPDVRIVVIGDSMPWFSDKIIHIPHTPDSTNPQVDVAQKMMAAIASDLVPEEFIWSNDDIYTLCPVDLADIMVLKAHGRLSKRGALNGIYQQNSLRTVAALKKEGFTNPYDFATHTPVLLIKEYLAEVIGKFKCAEEGHLIYTLYANYWYRDHRPIITYNDGRGSIVASVYRANPDANILKEVFETRKWVNNNDNGWTAVQGYLKKLFPGKSGFEK